MKIFYYFGHPAQFHFQKHSIRQLKSNGHKVYIYIRTKDVLQNLLDDTGWKYKNILPNERKFSFLGILKSLILRNIILAKEILKHKPNLLIASDPSFSQLGFIFKIPCINCIDDDIDVIGFYPHITYPFTKHILTPRTVRVGKYKKKRISYNGYMKLAYLHPNWFTPNFNLIEENLRSPFFLIRLTKLTAHHDKGASGIGLQELCKLISLLKPKGKIIISSEDELGKEFNQYLYDIPASLIHHYIYYAQLLICDSQSMAGEAAMLGTPSIRLSSFVGKLSVLEELEHKYQLTFGVKPDQLDKLYDKVFAFLKIPNLKDEFRTRRKIMLTDKIDVSAFLIWFIENYPESANIMQKNPDYQYIFK